MFLLAIPVGLGSVGYRNRIDWDAKGFRISRGIFGFQSQKVFRCEEIEALTLYGQCLKGMYLFSLWADMVDGRKVNLMSEDLRNTVHLEQKAELVSDLMKIAIRKDESYYSLMKQATNARKRAK